VCESHSCPCTATETRQGGLCRRRSGDAPCWTELVPANSTTDTAEPISEVGGTSVKMYLRKDKKCQRGRRRGNKRGRNNRGKTMVRGRGATWQTRHSP